MNIDPEHPEKGLEERLVGPVVRLQNARNELKAALDEANLAGAGLIKFVASGHSVIAELSKGVPLPAEVEQRCDIVMRARPNGGTQWLKYYDHALPSDGE